MSPKRTIPELITAAQNDGWHNDPLGREIIAELALRMQVAARPRQIIAGLSVGLALCLGLLGWIYAQNSRLAEQASTGLAISSQAKQTAASEIAAAKGETAQAKERADSERARAIAAEKQVETITAALNGQQAAVVRQFTEQLAMAKEENTRLRDEVALWKAAAAKTTRP